MPEFPGFPADFFGFFEDLARNNHRDWFNDHRRRYQDSVLAPVSAFIVDMAPLLSKISRHFIADPRPQGGSMFRVRRDTRFSDDKTAYKTHTGIQFRHEAGKDAHTLSFYVHLAPDGLRYGGGIWRPPAPQLSRIRDYMADNTRAWARISQAKKVLDVGGVRGSSLKCAPRGFNPEHVHIEDLKRKSLYVMAEGSPAAALEPDFTARVDEAFRRAGPLNRFLGKALELPF
ncbi:MAG: DUF2461 domain-containing protein [Xanthomonadales bacterium]|nr:DUF2461 domain-containing protein [Xanthomonadales bacterium]